MDLSEAEESCETSGISGFGMRHSLRGHAMQGHWSRSLRSGHHCGTSELFTSLVGGQLDSS